MELPDTLSRAQKKFVRTYLRTGDQKKAALKAFPEKDNPVAYASKILNDKEFQRSLIEYLCDANGLSDERLIKEMARGLKKMSWYGKSAATKLKLIEVILKLKDRFPEQKRGGDMHFTQNNNTQTNNVITAKEEVIKEIWQRASKRMTVEQMDAAIIDVEPTQRRLPPVNAKETLFTDESDVASLDKIKSDE